jgi:hypothetical protein
MKKRKPCKECGGSGRIDNNRGRYIPPDQVLFVSHGLLRYECLACKPKKRKERRG